MVVLLSMEEKKYVIIMTKCNVVALFVGLIFDWFVSNLGKRKKYLININGKYFIIQYTVTGDNFSAVIIHSEQYNHIFYGLVSHNINIILAPQ